MNESYPLAPYLVSAAAVLGGGIIAMRVGRTRGLAAAGLVLVALTPLVPTLRMPLGFGLSSDDVLPLLGVALLLVALRRAPRADGRAGWLPAGVLRWSLVAGLGMLLVGGAISAVANGDDPADAIRLLIRGAGRYMFLGLIVVAVGVTISRRSALRGTALTWIAIMGTIEAAFGLAAYLLPLPGKLGLEPARKATVLFGEIPGRVSGTLGISPDFTGAILMVSLITTVGLALASAGAKRRLWLTASVLQLVTLSLTFARTPLALALIGVAALLFLARRPILVLPVVAISGLAAIATPLGARFLSDSNDRLALWSAAVRLISDHPIGGVGPGQMLSAMRANPERYMQTDLGLATNNAHNTILLAGAEMGVAAAIGALLVNAALGLLALLSIRDQLRRRAGSETAIAGGIAVLAVLAQGMVNNLFTVGATSVILALLVGAFLWPEEELADQPAQTATSLRSSPTSAT